MSKIQKILLVVIVIGLGLIFTKGYWAEPFADFVLNQETEIAIKNDPLNTAYVIEGKTFVLKDGKAEKEVALDSTSSPQAGSASKEVVQIFGEPVYGDLNGDGVKDAALFLTVQSGGSGTFFYAAEAISVNGKYKGTNAVFLGDRIAPQNINIIDGVAVANFAERNPGESFAVSPSVGKSVWLNLTAESLVGVIK